MEPYVSTPRSRLARGLLPYETRSTVVAVSRAILGVRAICPFLWCTNAHADPDVGPLVVIRGYFF